MMCGLAAYLSINRHSARIIREMTDVIRHRGPDDEGFALFSGDSTRPVILGGIDTPENAYHTAVNYAPQQPIGNGEHDSAHASLGHRRLSIVDLSPFGHQPMASADGRFWLAYNGEIYNFFELREELRQLGCVFLTESDTEVILWAFQTWGSACLSRFRGMFALLIFDGAERRLFGARDRFGIKPLYYHVSGGGIAFASEIKQFSTLPGWSATLNAQRAYDFLCWGVTDHTDETLFLGVRQLTAGQAFTLSMDSLTATSLSRIDQDGLEAWTWYDLASNIPRFDESFTDASRLLADKLTESVSLHMRADVPVGSCLSGGLDSSAIVCIANRLLRSQGSAALQKTFSACSDVSAFDERKWMELVVSATGVDAHFVYPSATELFTVLPKLIWHQDEPFGSTSIFAQWTVFRDAAANRVKVMLDGQGADEQLAGYHGFFGPHLAALVRALRFGKALREAKSFRRVHGTSLGTSTMRVAANFLPQGIRDIPRVLRGDSGLRPAWLDRKHIRFKPVAPFRSIEALGVNELSIAQLTRTSLPMLLHWEDRNSMSHSIEARVPFLDHELVELVMSMPTDFRLDSGVTKRVLREAMTGVIPDPISRRIDKLGFVTPEESWLRGTMKAEFRSGIESAIVASQGVLEPGASRKMFQGLASGAVPFSFLPWRLISFGAWMNCHSVKP